MQAQQESEGALHHFTRKAANLSEYTLFGAAVKYPIYAGLRGSLLACLCMRVKSEQQSAFTVAATLAVLVQVTWQNMTWQNMSLR